MIEAMSHGLKIITSSQVSLNLPKYIEVTVKKPIFTNYLEALDKVYREKLNNKIQKNRIRNYCLKNFSENYINKKMDKQFFNIPF